MKVIEGLKRIKELQRKVADLTAKVSMHCADMEIDSPVYGTAEQQSQQIKDWLQSVHDSTKEILNLRVAIQRTNLEKKVTMVIAGVEVEHTIAEWIHRRRDLAELEKCAWNALSDRGLKPVSYSPSGKRGTAGSPPDDVAIAKVRRFYDPKMRDEKIEMFTSEPATIDAKLEVVNAETDLMM